MRAKIEIIEIVVRKSARPTMDVGLHAPNFLLAEEPGTFPCQCSCESDNPQGPGDHELLRPIGYYWRDFANSDPSGLKLQGTAK